jgi:hypothetical protein
MRTRLRRTLPLVQAAIAIALLVSNRLRDPWETRPAFLAPDLQFCCALNAPATVVWVLLCIFKGELYFEHPFLWDIIELVAYVLLIGLLWYVVSIEISGSGQSVLTPKTRIRSVADLLMIAFAGYVAAFGFSVRSHEFGFVTTYSNLVATPYFLWAVTIATFYGNDLWVRMRAKRVRRN